MKVVVPALLVLFLGYWMVQEPELLARCAEELVSWSWDMLSRLFSAVIDVIVEICT